MTRIVIRRVCCLVALLITGGLQACSTTPLQPWERGDLARPEMAWSAGIAGESAIRSHTYVSKEAAADNAALGGGGCGCN